MDRLDMMKKKHEEGMEPFTWLEVKILLDEIHERDILINDFREQKKDLKEEIKRLKSK